MRWPLRNQILIPFAGVMLAAILAVTLINAYLAAQRSTDQIQEQLASIGRTMQESQFPLTEPVLRQAKGLSGAEFVVADGQGRILAATMALPPARFDDAMEPSRLLQVEGTNYLHLSIRRARRGSEDTQLIHILYPLASWYELQRQAAMPPIVVGGTALVLVGAIATALAYRIANPIRQVTTQVAKIVAHDQQMIEVPRTDDELRQLVLSFNALASDVTTLTDAVKRSERLAMLGKLSGGLAHHLRNGVTGAKLALQLHRRKCREVDPESLEVAERQLELIEQHLKRFLAMGQPQSLRLQPIQLKPWLEDVVNLVRPACAHRGVDCRLEGGSPLTVVDVDAEQLRQGLLNLLLNAIEAAGTSGVVSLEVETPDGGMLRMRICDTGPGVAKEIEPRLFEPFATDKPEGVGLGLAVTRQIVESHRGTIAYRRTGDRSCFEITLPLQSTRSSDEVGEGSRNVEEVSA